MASIITNWSAVQYPMQSEGNGYWYVDVPTAKEGDEYKFVIVNQQTGEIYWRNDPYAKAVTNSVGKSVVVSPDFDWTDQDFQSNEWVTKDTGAGGAGFDAQWDCRFVHAIRDAIVTPWMPSEIWMRCGMPSRFGLTAMPLNG